MTASESSPTEGHECDGESEYEQRVLRQILKAQTERVSDDLRLRDGDDLDEQLREVRRARAELSVIETLLTQYVDEPQEDDESDE